MLAAGGLPGRDRGEMSGMTRSRFRLQQELISLMAPAQGLDPVNREGDGGEILVYLSL